jgi:hypothetical protein
MLIGKTSKKISSLIIFVFFASIIFSILFYAFFAADPEITAETDFINYLTGANLIREGRGQLIYDLKTQSLVQKEIIKPYVNPSILPFRSLPFVGLLFLPFSYFNFVQGYKLFVIFNLLVLTFFTYLSGRLFPKIKKYKFWLLIPFVFLPSVKAIILGQVTPLLLLLFLFLYVLVRSKKSLAAGAVCALLLARPQYLIMSPFIFLLAEKKRRFAAGFFLSSAFLIVISVLLSGLDTILDYPSFLLSTEGAIFGSKVPGMFAVNSVLVSFLDHHYALFANGLLYLLAFFVYLKNYKLIGYEMSFVSAVLFTLLFAVHVLGHDLTILLIPVFVLLKTNPLLATILFLLPGLLWTASPAAVVIITLVIALILLKPNWPRAVLAKVAKEGK